MRTFTLALVAVGSSATRLMLQQDAEYGEAGFVHSTDGSLYPRPHFSDLGPWDSNGDGHYDDEEWYDWIAYETFDSRDDDYNYYTTREELEQIRLSFNEEGGM